MVGQKSQKYTTAIFYLFVVNFEVVIFKIIRNLCQLNHGTKSV